MNPKTNTEVERNKKVRIVEKIDNLRVVQNNHYIIGELENALKIAEQIIDLAKEAKLNSIVDEQQEFIDKLRDKIKERGIIALIKDVFEVLKSDFSKLTAENKIFEAHNRVVQFKINYEKSLNLSSFPNIKELFLKDEELWNDFVKNQDKLNEKLKSLEKQFNKHLENNDFNKLNETLNKAKEIVSISIDEEMKKSWEKYEIKFNKTKRQCELVETIKKSINESSKLKEKFLFEESIHQIEKTMELIKSEDMEDYLKKLENKRQEIIAAETKYNKLYLMLADYKGKLRENQAKNFLNAAVKNCERILHISQLIGMSEIEMEYAQILNGIKKEIEKRESKSKEEINELLNKVKKFGNCIQKENDILPIIEEFFVKDILGELSNDPSEKLEQVGSLLNEHRVAVKKEIISKVIYVTSSDEIFQDLIPREITKLGGEEESAKYQVRSWLTNRLEDTIEKGTITDTIPYNFEILNVELNGKRVEDLNINKAMTKEGIEFKWQVENLAPKKKVEINYNLRRRISRTIIFVIKDQLKIVKMHSNLKERKEGFYEVIISFKNSFGAPLEGMIVEDIVPLYYLHFVSEPTNLLPEKTKGLEIGELFKWSVGNMDIDTLNYNYKLLELYKFEEIKTMINNLNQNCLKNLNKGDIKTALAEYKELKQQILNFVK